jgi:putative ABC transport system permease protein
MDAELRFHIEAYAIAIRTALGAGRGRLLLQLFTESLVFAVATGFIGIGVAFAGTRGLLTVLPKAEILLRLDSVKVDFRGAGFCLCAHAAGEPALQFRTAAAGLKKSAERRTESRRPQRFCRHWQTTPWANICRQ